MRFARHYQLFALAALLVLVVAVPAFAADPHAGEKGGGILDKLNFSGIKRYDLGIYTLIVFGILMFVLSKFAWPHIKSGLEKREANIGGQIAEAKRDRAEAEAKLADANKQLAEAATKAKAILDEARRDADVLKASEREVGVKDAQAERDRVKRDLAIERDAVSKQLHQQVVELATLIASKAIRQQMSLDKQGALVDESIAELKANANKA